MVRRWCTVPRTPEPEAACTGLTSRMTDFERCPWKGILEAGKGCCNNPEWDQEPSEAEHGGRSSGLHKQVQQGFSSIHPEGPGLPLRARGPPPPQGLWSGGWAVNSLRGHPAHMLKPS